MSPSPTKTSSTTPAPVAPTSERRETTLGDRNNNAPASGYEVNNKNDQNVDPTRDLEFFSRLEDIFIKILLGVSGLCFKKKKGLSSSVHQQLRNFAKKHRSFQFERGS